MNNNSDRPKVVSEAFPVLDDALFVRQLASPVPLTPDTTFDIYVKDSKDFIALVTTDYAEPLHQSQELKGISGQYEFKFSSLIRPYDKYGNTIKVLENDDMEGDFFITAPHKNYKLYYYLANLTFKN